MSRTPRRYRLAATAGSAFVLAAVPLAGAQASHVEAASGLSLLAQAEHNTNTVRTLTHHDTQTVHRPTSSVALTLSGMEDEVHNRESDSESVKLTSKGQDGKQRTQKYSLNIIFMNGKTYYRTSLAKNKWKTSKGMSLRDPFTGVGWRRARTTVPTIASVVKNVKYRPAGTSGGLAHFHATFKQSAFAGTDDLYVSTGAKPYVVREEQRYHYITNVKLSVVTIEHFTGLNAPLVITAPGQQSTTA